MSAPLRILYLQPAASFGGAERQAAEAIRLLPEFGVDVVPVVGPGLAIVDALREAGVERFVYHADLPDDPKTPRDASARAALCGAYTRAYFRLTRDLAHEARRAGTELLYASRPFAWVISGVVGAQLQLPVVWRAGTAFEHWSQPAMLRVYARARPPRAVVYTSSSVLRTIAPSVPAPAFVLHNGVDNHRFAPRLPLAHAHSALRRELGLAPGARLVAWVGRIAPEKGIEMLVDACRHLGRMAPSATVVVAGDSGWRAHLEERARGAGLGDRLRLIGFVRDIERVYEAADVVVSTSVAEGCPNALLEAMAMGRAVVATRVGGTAEILRDGRDGLLVEPGDAEGFARAVAELCAATARREELGRSAARRVATHFSLRAQVGRLAEILWWAAGRDLPAHLSEAAASRAQADGLGRPPRRWAVRPRRAASLPAMATASLGSAHPGELGDVEPAASTASAGPARPDDPA